MAETWTIQRLLAWTSSFFGKKGLDSPRLTAELLLARALHCDRVRLYMDFERPLNKDELAAFRALIERRAAGEPTFYLLGAREFFGRTFEVDRRVLVPRPETELVVETALQKLPATASRALELCTGSGCIGLSLLAERPTLSLVAIDLSRDALDVATANATSLAVADRCELLQGDLFAPVAGRTFPLVVANPPYVASGVIPGLKPEVLAEPRMALDGGADGLQILERIVAQAPAHLEEGAWLILEIGEGQGASLLSMFQAAGLVDAAILRDLANLERVALARRPGAAP